MLKEAGFWYFMPVAGRNVVGIPDFICCTPKGRFFAIETKANGGTLTPLQDRVMSEIDRHHGYTLVVWPATIDNLQAMIELLK